MQYAGPTAPGFDLEYFRKTGQNKPAQTFGDVMRQFESTYKPPSYTPQTPVQTQSYSAPQSFGGGLSADVLKNKFGFNDSNVINSILNNPNERARYEKELGSGGGSSAPDPAALARQMLQLQIEANKPAVQSLEAQIPTIQQGYATRKTSLEGQRPLLQERYQNLLDTLTSRRGQEQKKVEIATAREYGRRGLSPSSGQFEQDLAEKLRPQTEYYTGQEKDIGLARQTTEKEIADALALLPTQQVGEEQQVRQAIAQLQAGGASSGIQQALQLYQMQQQAAQTSQSQVLQERLAQLEAAKNNYLTLGEGSTLFNILTGKPMFTAPKQYKAEAYGTDANDIAALRKLLGGGNTSNNRYSLVP